MKTWFVISIISAGIIGILLVILTYKLNKTHSKFADKKVIIGFLILLLAFLSFFNYYNKLNDITLSAIRNFMETAEDVKDNTEQSINEIVDAVQEKKSEVQQKVENIQNKIQEVQNEISDVTDAISKPLDQSKSRDYYKNYKRDDPIFIDVTPNKNTDSETESELKNQIENLKKENEKLKKGCVC